MALLDDFAAAIEGAAIADVGGVQTGWALMLGYLQDQPDRAVCLYEIPGQAPEEGFGIDYPGLQVRVRGRSDDYRQVRAKLQAVFDLLHANETVLNNQTSPPSQTYVFCYAMSSGPVPLGQDENRRPALAQRYRIMKQRQA